MGISNVSQYRGYQLNTTVHPANTSSAGYVGTVSVELNGMLVGQDRTGIFSKFQFAEASARSLGQQMVDLVFNNSNKGEQQVNHS